MFFNRKQELQQLRELYKRSSKHRQLLYITGRRRVGKTTIINEFCRTHKALYVFVTRTTETEFLRELSELIGLEMDMPGFPAFTTLDGAFRFIFDTVVPKRIVIFDEFQNGHAIHQAFFSIFQKHWDRTKDKGGGFVACCGSMQTMMHTIFEGQKEPLYKRATARMPIEEFEPDALWEYVCAIRGKEDVDTFLDLYTIFGGIPFYYYILDATGLARANVERIVRELLFTREGLLHDEGRDLTVEAFGKKYGVYYAILCAIATGCTKMSEIAARTGHASGALEPYMDHLISTHGFVRRLRPILSKKPRGKTTRYMIADNMLAFWFRYVLPRKSIIEQGRTDTITTLWREDFPCYRGLVFERLTRNLLTALNKQLNFPFHFDVCGSYFDQKGAVEIDVLLANSTSTTIAVGECKANLNSSNIPALVGRLQQHAVTVKGYTTTNFFLFSATELSAKTKNIIKKFDNVRAFSLAELLRMGTADA